MLPTDVANALTPAGELLAVALALACAGHALLNQRDPRSAAGWIILCLLVPPLGALAYLLVGANRTHRRSPRRRDAPGRGPHAVQGSAVVRAPPPPTAGNVVEPELDAAAALERMLAAVRAARERVWLSEYIFEPEGVGARYVEALTDAASRGLDVCVLLDRVGTLYNVGSTRRRLQEGGVRVAMFLPPHGRPFRWRINLRNHRKLLVVDDDLAFTGGMNIRNDYLPRRGGSEAPIRDAHFACRGPVMADLAQVFRGDWHAATGETLAELPSPPAGSGPVECRVIVDGPDNDVDLLMVSLLAAMGTATRHVRVMTPYFLPPPEIVSGLQAAALRGVTVDVVIPARNNLPFVHWATLHAARDLLRYGVRLTAQAGSFDHGKLIVIDDDRCFFGSMNLDYRSLRLNFELAVEAFDAPLAATLAAHVDARAGSGAPLTLDDVGRLPFWMRVRNALAWLASPYL